MTSRILLRLAALAAALAVALALLVVAGCSTAMPTRPPGNLTDLVNSPANEFAPVFRPGSATLFFTSDRAGMEDLMRARPLGGWGSPYIFAEPGASDSGDLRALSRASTNDGALTFISENAGFFASAHSPDTAYARARGTYGGIVGGSDLFAFSLAGNGPRAENLGPAINSRFWDSHPAAAQRGDSLLLIFASDRPADGVGHGAPFPGAAAEAGRGNADLYYTMRVGGRWMPVRNLATAEGAALVNTPRNEYTPFIHCLAQRPRLFFASDRAGSFDIYEAEFTADFVRGTLSFAAPVALPSGPGGINTSADEMFPFLFARNPDGESWLYLASNRDSMPCTCNEGEGVWSVGGFDLYRFPLVRECRLPRIRYEVLMLDAEAPSRPVPQPLLRLYRIGAGSDGIEPKHAPDAERTTARASFELEAGARYALFGGSRYDTIECSGGEPTISRYAFTRRVAMPPEIRERDTIVEIDTTIGGSRVRFVDTVQRTDTIAIDSLATFSASEGVTIRSLEKLGDRLLVRSMVVRRGERLAGGRSERRRVRRIVRDTLERWRDVDVPTVTQLAPSASVLTAGGQTVAGLRADTAIFDTVWVRPMYYQPPPCRPLGAFALQTELRESVPYFQTLFWEVNTSENLRRDLRRMESGDLEEARFVELHARNAAYVGEPERRWKRLEEYRTYAAAVDSNLNRIADLLAEQIVPAFLGNGARRSNADKLLVQVAAFSDYRRISFGYYAGADPVRYTGGSYDTITGALRLYDVDIAPNAGLTSQDNDTLSKLRAYFACRELIARMAERHPAIARMIDDGTMLVAGSGLKSDEVARRIERARIVVLTEGRYVDRAEQGAGGDSELDRVRRMDLRVDQLRWNGSTFEKSDCCVDTQR